MSESATQAPTCFRHPNRETYVSCVRCGRHACPECMRPASVGQQCVECVRDGHRTARVAKTAFGGRPATGAIVTWSLIAINVGVFIATAVKPSITTNLEMLGYATYTGHPPWHGVAAGEWWRLITATFLAPAKGQNGLGVLDILFNMVALAYLGPALERLLGKLRFIGLYLLSGLGGSVFYFWVAAQNEAAVGASGAIFGLFGAWFVVSRRLRLDSRGIVTLIAINLAISFTWSAIAWQAHVGGLIAGVLISLAYAYAPRQNRALIQAGATAGLLVLLIVAVAIRDHQLTSQVAAVF